MAKKKIKTSDLDLSPRQVGKSCSDSSSRAVATSFEACDMSRLCNVTFACNETDTCKDTDDKKCFHTNNVACGQTHNVCQTDLQCPGTNVGCVDSNSAAVQCCAHTGNDCVESGAACPGTYKNCPTDKTCTCPVYTDDCGITQNNLCADTIVCQTEGGLPCAVSANLDECPETKRGCVSRVVCPTGDDCTETRSIDCMITDDDICVPITNINCEETDPCD